MAFREQNIPRATYRYGLSRSRQTRLANAMSPRAGGDNSWDLRFPTPAAFRITASPDPDANVDRDLIALQLLSAQSQTVSGVEDRAARFTGGSTSQLSVSTDFRPSDQSGAISVWFKASDLVAVPFIVKANTANTRYVSFRVITTGGNFYVAILGNLAGTDHEVRGSTALSENTWYHVVVSSNGSAWTLYLNGVAETLVVVSGSNNGTWYGDVAGNNLFLGRNSSGSIFAEYSLDEVGVFSEAITAANVTYLYNNGSGRLATASQSVPGLVNYWSLSTNHVGIGDDKAGGLTLTVGSGVDDTGGILIATLGQDRAVVFIGDTQGSKMSASTNLRSADTSGSISFWFRPASIGQEPLITKHDNTASNRLEIQKNGSNQLSIIHRIAAGTTNEVRGGTTLTAGAWHHIAIVSSGTAWALYVDGAAETLTVVSGSNTGDWFGDLTGTLWRFGEFQASATSADGRLDEVGIWSTQLTAANVTTLYAAGDGVLYDQARLITGLVHYWSLSQNDGGIGADRLGGVTMTVTERVYDEVGITAGAASTTSDVFNSQVTLGIRNNEGFIELQDDAGMLTWRIDDSGMQWEHGGTLVEEADGAMVYTVAGSDPDFTLQTLSRTIYFYDDSAANITFLSSIVLDATLGGTVTFESGSTIQEQADGELILTAKGTDPDITLQSNTVSAALVFDQSVPEWVFFGDVGIDGTTGGRITFASNSYLVEESDGALTMRAVGTDPDILFETNTVTSALLFDQSIPEWVFFGELSIDNTAGGRIQFASNSTITEQSDGELTFGAVGTDPDILFTANAGSVVNTMFIDQSAGTAMFFNTKVRIDSTGAADGGGFTFEPGSVYRVTATTGLTSFRAVGTNPDLQLGSTTYVNAFYWDFSLTNLALLAGTDTLQTMTIGAAGVTTANIGRVDIYQRGTTDALPVLVLSQADVSEEFIRFIGTSANAVLTQSIVEAADVATATLAGYVKVFIVDDGNQLTDQAYYLAAYTLA